MSVLARVLVVAAIAWPALLGATVWERASGSHPAWTSFVYAVSSRICHQIPSRSFHTDNVQWPVCARCSGLYLAAPIGALAALTVAGRRGSSRNAVGWLVVAAVPTAITLVIQWLGIGQPSNLIRFVAALPLGTAVAWVLVRTAAGSGRSDRVN
jgi:uncharacterized membrane protein